MAPASSYIASCCSRSASSSTALTLVRKSSAAAPATSDGGDFSARRKVRKGMTVISRQAPTRRSISATSAMVNARLRVACHSRNSSRLTSTPASSCRAMQVSATLG